MPEKRLRAALGNPKSIVDPIKGTCNLITQVKVDIRRERRDKYEKTTSCMEIMLGIAVKHPQKAKFWVGMWQPTSRQILKSRFENSINYSNALTSL